MGPWAFDRKTVRWLLLWVIALPLLSVNIAHAYPTGEVQSESRIGKSSSDIRVARKRRKRRRRRPRRTRPRRTRRRPAAAARPAIAAPRRPAPAARAAAAPAPTAEAGLRRGARVEFDGRLVQGQTAKSGAIYLFARKRSELRSMVKERSTYRLEIIRTVYPARKRKAGR